jgi:hypothetical protein
MSINSKQTVLEQSTLVLAQVGNETFWSIGKGESKQAGASPGGAVTDGQRTSLLVGWFPPCV